MQMVYHFPLEIKCIFPKKRAWLCFRLEIARGSYKST